MKTNMKHVDTKQLALDERASGRVSAISMSVYGFLFVAWLIVQLQK